MLLLGAVQLFEPVNGYQIRRELVSWRVDEWAHINPGSIYSGLETLARAGHLARHALVEGSRTVTVYTTTEAGRDEFQRLFAEAVRVHDRGSARGFTTALSLQPLVDRKVFLGLLEERLRAVDALLAEGEALASSPAGDLPPHLPPLIGLWQAQAATERSWLVDTIAGIRAGSGVVRRRARPTGRRRRTTRAGPCRPTASATARLSASPTDRAPRARPGTPSSGAQVAAGAAASAPDARVVAAAERGARRRRHQSWVLRWLPGQPLQHPTRARPASIVIDIVINIDHHGRSNCSILNKGAT